MPVTRCMICKNPTLREIVDTALDKGKSNAGISAMFEQVGAKLDPEVIGRHKNNHWKPPVDPAAPQPTKRDLAISLRDRVAKAIDDLPAERGALVDVIDLDGKRVTGFIETDPILDKDLAPALSAGLKAQALLDKREVNQQRLGLAQGYLGLQLLLQGLGEPPVEPLMIDDPDTIEGEVHEVG